MFKSALKLVAAKWPFPVKTRLKNGSGIYVDLRSAVSRGIYSKGEFDPLVFKAIASELRASDILLDVGSNVGVYSIQSLEIVGTSGNVHAFEIDPRPLRCLELSKKRFHYDNLHIHSTAVGSAIGKVQLNQDHECGNSQVSLVDGGTQVPMVSLDTWMASNGVDRVNVIKIDVEGFELEVLKGAQEILARNKPSLIIEADDRLLSRTGASVEMLTGYLSSFGYTCTVVNDTWSPTLVARYEVQES
jgi:FkbM family methyltransferase